MIMKSRPALREDINLIVYRHPPTVLSPNARYDKVLAAFGGNGYYVNTPEEIQKALKESVANTKQASLVNIMINTMADRRAQVRTM